MKIVEKFKTAIRTEKTLRFYASPVNYESLNKSEHGKSEIEKDSGKRALQVLSKLRGKGSKLVENELESTLEFYGNKGNYNAEDKLHELYQIEKDFGEKARVALNQLNNVKK